MRYQVSTTVQAQPHRLWEVLSDVERWPEWIAVYRSVTREDTGPLRLGSRARVDQPGFATATWEVTELEEGSSFTWESRTPGVRTVGRHTVIAGRAGSAGLTLVIEQSGPLAGLIGLLLGGKARRYVDLELASLAAAAEGATA